MSRLPALALLVAVTSGTSAQELELTDGSEAVFEVPTASGNEEVVNQAFFFDAPGGIRNALIQLSDGGAGRDIDIFLRADQPFSETAVADDLFEEADFWSISGFGDEFVNLQDFSSPAVGGRRWHVAIVGFSGPAVDARLSLTFSRQPAPDNAFEVDFSNATGAGNCNTAPWNDGAPYTPRDGNDATTVGQARRNAMLKAAELLSAELSSRVPIRIRACWRDLGPSENGAQTLAGARSNRLPINSPGLPRDLIHTQATATRLAGTDVCRIFGGFECADQEVIISFNEQAADRFYYGFDPADSSTPGLDFITISMHEIIHGLGFFGLLGSDGRLETVSGRQVADVFVHQLATLRNGAPVRLDDPSLSDADRAEAVVSFDNLLWIDDQAAVQESNTLLNFEAGLVRMHAPTPFNPGSSVFHVSNAYCDLMRPTNALCTSESLRSLGMSRRIMDGVGWADSNGRLPFIGQYFDRARAGHGFDLQLGGTDSQGREVYVLTFYSYETRGGRPEWFQAVGVIDNGAFTGIRNADGNGFPRYLYDPGREPPQQADPDTFSQVAVSLNAVANSPACTDGVDRRGAVARVSFQWAIGNQVGEWCAEPLVSPATRPEPAGDFGGLWFASEEDQGWGFSLENIVTEDGTVDVFVLLYVYAQDGTPVWFFGLEEDFTFGTPTTVTLFERTGFPRIREFGELVDTEAGSMTLTLREPSNEPGAGNFASVNVTYSEGGAWIRDETEIRRLSLDR